MGRIIFIMRKGIMEWIWRQYKLQIKLAPRVGIKPLSSYLSLNDCFEQHNKNDTYSY